MHHRPLRTGLTLALAAAVCQWASVRTWGQTPAWMPTTATHAWSRFGPGAWKVVQVRKSALGTNGKVERSSTTIARTRVITVGLRSYSLCVTSIVEVEGSELADEPKTISRDICPHVESSKVVGEEHVTIEGQKYATQVISFVSTSGTQREENTIYFCQETTPQLLKRTTKFVDSANPEMATETTLTVTEINRMADILGELKCTWASTTVKRMRDRTITVREVNCAEVPGELVSQITEEHNANGVLVARQELELVGCGYGRPRRLFRRR